MLKDVDSQGNVTKTVFKVKSDTRPFDLNTVITKEQALSIFHDVAPKIKANMFSSQPIKAAMKEFNEFLNFLYFLNYLDVFEFY